MAPRRSLVAAVCKGDEGRARKGSRCSDRLGLSIGCLANWFLRAVEIVFDSTKNQMHAVEIVFDSTKKQMRAARAG